MTVAHESCGQQILATLSHESAVVGWLSAAVEM